MKQNLLLAAVVFGIVFVGVILSVVFVHQCNKHNTVTVLVAVSELKADIAEIEKEISGLRSELEAHDTKSLWWERKEK